MMDELSAIEATTQYLSGYPIRQIGSTLLERLRCPVISRLKMVTWAGPAKSASARSDLQACLPKMLQSRVGERVTRDATTSLLVGIAANADWSIYPSTEDDAYALAIEALYCVDAFRSGDLVDDRMDRFARSDICGMLNKWLKPAKPWRDIPGVVTMCRHMFGEPWCDLALPSKIRDGFGGYHLRTRDFAPDRIVELTRPPFLPGVCRGQLPLVCEVLPDDIGHVP